jgi:hypothetical protein
MALCWHAWHVVRAHLKTSEANASGTFSLVCGPLDATSSMVSIALAFVTLAKKD